MITIEIDEEALDHAAREGYAVRCKTNAPRIMQTYASKDVMHQQLLDARTIILAYLLKVEEKRKNQ
jgi:hypothetical protein